MATAKEQLKAFVERVERLEEEAKAIADDKRDVYAEAKSQGFDTRALRVIIRKRKLDQEERLNQEHLVETYMVALGMGWGKSEDDIDASLDRRRTDAGKAKTERNGKPPPRAQACLAGQLDLEDFISSDVISSTVQTAGTDGDVGKRSRAGQLQQGLPAPRLHRESGGLTPTVQTRQVTGRKRAEVQGSAPFTEGSGKLPTG